MENGTDHKTDAKKDMIRAARLATLKAGFATRRLT